MSADDTLTPRSAKPTTKAAGAAPSALDATSAAAQLRRLLALVPHIADGEAHPVAEVARLADTDTATLVRDLRALVGHYDAPGGFVEGLTVFLEAETVEVHARHFQRPMALVAGELRALELGLAMLAAERPHDEQGGIAGARTRLQQALATLRADAPSARDAADPRDAATLAAGPAAPLDEAARATLAVLRDARRARRKVRLRYRKADAAASDARTVCPYALAAARGAWYLIAWCEASAAIRIFRLDRIETVTPTAERFELPPDFHADAVLQDGRAFQPANAPRALVVRYAPGIARWIAERETGTWEPDGALVVAHPLADEAWAVRHVLQYGPEAEVLEPESVRAAIAARLDALLGDVASEEASAEATA